MRALNSYTRVIALLAVVIVATGANPVMGQSSYPFVDEDFVVPDNLETDEFRLRMLTVNDVVKDYDAVMSSVDHLSKVWPESGWPDELTLEEDLIDLGWHQREFMNRSSFAYTMVTLDESTVVGWELGVGPLQVIESKELFLKYRAKNTSKTRFSGLKWGIYVDRRARRFNDVA